MKAYLMYRDRDFDLQQKLPSNEEALTQDLELNKLTDAMSREDQLIFNVVRTAILIGLQNDLGTIAYRQAILKDCLRHPTVIRHLYKLAGEAIEKERKQFGGWSDYPAGILSRSITVLEIFVELLKSLKALADEQAGSFASEGFTKLFAMLSKELEKEYFTEIQDHLKRLKFRNGVLMSAELGKGNKGTAYVLRRRVKEENWMEWLFAKKPPVYSFNLHPRDEGGARALSELQNRGINLVANALAQSTDHILSFFKMLRIELAFYIGCLNLHDKLTAKSESTCFPAPAAPGERRLSCSGLYDVCLTLSVDPKVVGNDLSADGKGMLIITGANRGGKSTFLRGMGLSQLMMQCGLFVPAQSFHCSVCDSLFTHYKREEDASMKSGKLDEELSRMSVIVDNMTPNSIVLFNESFAATNEREGSEIARQITSALLEKGIRMFFVTHLYTFAHGCHATGNKSVMFLRAERQLGGERSFKLVEGEPLQTSYAEDLYSKLFKSRSGKSDEDRDVVTVAAQ